MVDLFSDQITAVGTLSNVITQIQNLPTMELGKRFRNPCKTGDKCGKVICHRRKFILVPRISIFYQLFCSMKEFPVKQQLQI